MKGPLARLDGQIATGAARAKYGVDPGRLVGPEIVDA